MYNPVGLSRALIVPEWFYYRNSTPHLQARFANSQETLLVVPRSGSTADCLLLITGDNKSHTLLHAVVVMH